MGTGYTRNDTANNIADGNVINASDLDGEFDAVQAAFNASTGHSHDGTTGEGPQIDASGIANNAVALGTKTTGNYVATLTAGALIDLQNNSGEGATPTIDVDLTELTDMTETAVGADELVILDGGTAQKRKAISEIPLSIFNNDSSFSTTTGTVTSVGTTGTVNGITLTGTVTSSGNLTLGGTLGNITFSQIDGGAVTTSSESFADNDTTLMTSAAINDRIESFGYTTNTGDITGVTAGTGLSGGGSSGDVTLALDFSELTDMTGSASGTTEFILQDGTTESRKAASEIALSIFNNDSGFAAGDVTLAGSQELTNKTIDVDNNTVSNIEVDNFKSGVLDTDISSVAATDTTLASAKAIKTYVDAQVAGSGMSNLVEDTSPQLGGNLDLNSKTINGSGTINYTGSLTQNGNTNLYGGTLKLSGSYSQGTENSVLGEDAMQNGMSSGVARNVAIGFEAGKHVNSGLFDDNTIIGHSALLGVQDNANSSHENVAIGSSALKVNLSGDDNVAIGYKSMTASTGTDGNTAVGHLSLFNFNNSSGGTGKNTAVGSNAGNAITTGAKNTLIGCYDGNSGGLDIRTSDNNIVLSDGDGNIRMYTNSSGNTGFGTVSPAHKIDVDGTVNATTVSTDNPISNRNLIINGAMKVAQRGTTSTATGYKTVDRFTLTMINFDNAAITQAQSSLAPTGFSKSYRIDCTTTETALAADEFANVAQVIEAQNLQHIQNGSSGAKSLTLSFYVKSSKTGTYGVNLYKPDNTGRQISATYTISVADTWEYKTITFAGDTAGGGISDDTGGGMYVYWHLAAGSNYTSSDSTSWSNYADAGFAFGHAVNIFDNTANDWAVTGVQLEVGTVATPFEHRSFGDELARCQRYFESVRAYFEGGTDAGGRDQAVGASFSVEKRVAPTVTRTSIASTNIASHQTSGANGTGSAFTRNRTTAAGATFFHDQLDCDSEL